MKLTNTEQEILDAFSITEQVKEKASELTIKWFKIVEEQKPNSIPYVNEIEFLGENFEARNDLSHHYDYKGREDLTSFQFPVSWLFMDIEKVEQEMYERKNLIKKNKKSYEEKKLKLKKEAEKKLEILELKKLKKKYPEIK